MENSNEAEKIPINEEFPELDEPGCSLCNFRSRMFNSLEKKDMFLKTLQKSWKRPVITYLKERADALGVACQVSIPKARPLQTTTPI